MSMEIEATPELIDAAEWLQGMTSNGTVLVKVHAKNLLDILPEDVKNPTYDLPNIPGRYEDKEDDSDWTLTENGTWYYESEVRTLKQVAAYAPLKRMVPAPDPVTHSDILRIIDIATDKGENAVTIADRITDYVNMEWT